MLTNEMIEKTIASYVAEYEGKMKRTKWRRPIVGFAGADNPKFREIQRKIGPLYYMPKDLLADAKTIIAYFLPYDEVIVNSNIGGRQRSLEWDTAYFDTNNLIEEINLALYELLKREGANTAITEATIEVKDGEPYPVTSNWSHRHAAWVAGLGTFGLNNMLITKMGCCGRLGTLITSAKFKPTPMTKEEYCLYKIDKSCTLCTEQCNNDCYVEQGEELTCNTILCNEFLQYNTVPLDESPGDGKTCGKCLCGLPCSFRIP